MADSPLNRIDAEPGPAARIDDVPDRVRRRYLTETLYAA